jgi:hypothetical protein
MKKRHSSAVFFCFDLNLIFTRVFLECQSISPGTPPPPAEGTAARAGKKDFKTRPSIHGVAT